MKIAISSTGNSLDSTIDHRFGRCTYFVLYDTEDKTIEFIPNPNKNAEEKAGSACVQLMASKAISKIISGEFGLKIKSNLDSLKIQMIILNEPETKIKDIIDILNHDNE